MSAKNLRPLSSFTSSHPANFATCFTKSTVEISSTLGQISLHKETNEDLPEPPTPFII